MMSAMIGSRPVVGSSKKMISGSRGDGARQRHALLHAAREFGGPELAHLGAQPHLRQRLDRRGRAPPWPLHMARPGSGRRPRSPRPRRLNRTARRPGTACRTCASTGRAAGRRAASPPLRRPGSCPRSGRSRPRMHLIVTDLPVPEPPMMTKDLPGSMSTVDAVQHQLGAEALVTSTSGFLVREATAEALRCRSFAEEQGGDDVVERSGSGSRPRPPRWWWRGPRPGRRPGN